MSSSQKLQQGKNEQEIIQLAAEQVSILLERPVLYALAKGKGELQFQVTPAERREELLKSMTIEERGVADWVVKNNKRAGATTNTLSHAAEPLFSGAGPPRRDGRGGNSLQVLSGSRGFREKSDGFHLK